MILFRSVSAGFLTENGFLVHFAPLFLLAVCFSCAKITVSE